MHVLRGASNSLQLKGTGGHLGLTGTNNDRAKVECLSVDSRGVCVWHYFYWQQHGSRFSAGAVKVLSSSAKRSSAIMIFPPVLGCTNLSSYHVSQAEFTSSGTWKARWGDVTRLVGESTQHALRTWWSCRFLHFHVSLLIWLNFMNNVFLTGKHKMDDMITTIQNLPLLLQPSVELAGLNFSKWYSKLWFHSTLSSVSSSFLFLLMLAN